MIQINHSEDCVIKTSTVEDAIKSAYQHGKEIGSKQAVDEFLQKAIDKIREDTCGCAADAKVILKEIAEQIKEQKND